MLPNGRKRQHTCDRQHQHDQALSGLDERMRYVTGYIYLRTRGLIHQNRHDDRPYSSLFKPGGMHV
jgi:hypothetical protein